MEKLVDGGARSRTHYLGEMALGERKLGLLVLLDLGYRTRDPLPVRGGAISHARITRKDFIILDSSLMPMPLLHASSFSIYLYVHACTHR